MGWRVRRMKTTSVIWLLAGAFLFGLWLGFITGYGKMAGEGIQEESKPIVGYKVDRTYTIGESWL